MKLSVSQIAKIIGAQVIGDPSFIITGVCPFNECNSHDITFACDSRHLDCLDQTKAGAVIVPDTYVPDTYVSDTEDLMGTILLKTDSPKVSFFKLVSFFHPEEKITPGIHASAHIGHHVKLGKRVVIQPNVFIGNNVKIGDNVHLMPGVFIGDDVFIGDNTMLKPNVTIMEKTRIGKNVTIHSGTVIGSDGFGFVQNSEKHEKLVHIGYVRIGDDVEIGACNTIDRGTLGMTVIGNGVKTDNLVHIAHNVKIGDHTLIVAQVGIAGSATIGENVIIAGKAGITGHIKIGNNAIVGPCAGVHSDVPENEIVSGRPHMPHKQWRKVVSIISRLPEMRKNLFSFEKRLKNLESKNME